MIAPNDRYVKGVEVAQAFVSMMAKAGRQGRSQDVPQAAVLE